MTHDNITEQIARVLDELGHAGDLAGVHFRLITLNRDGVNQTEDGSCHSLDAHVGDDLYCIDVYKVD